MLELWFFLTVAGTRNGNISFLLFEDVYLAIEMLVEVEVEVSNVEGDALGAAVVSNLDVSMSSDL